MPKHLNKGDCNFVFGVCGYTGAWWPYGLPIECVVLLRPRQDTLLSQSISTQVYKWVSAVVRFVNGGFHFRATNFFLH